MISPIRASSLNLTCRRWHMIAIAGRNSRRRRGRSARTNVDAAILRKPVMDEHCSTYLTIVADHTVRFVGEERTQPRRSHRNVDVWRSLPPFREPFRSNLITRVMLSSRKFILVVLLSRVLYSLFFSFRVLAIRLVIAPDIRTKSTIPFGMSTPSTIASGMSTSSIRRPCSVLDTDPVFHPR